MDALYIAWEPELLGGFYRSLTRAVLSSSRVRLFVLHHGNAERRQILRKLRVTRRTRRRLALVDLAPLGPIYRSGPGMVTARALDTPWIADWGPLFVRDGVGRLAVVDPAYPGERVNDDAAPTKLAGLLGLPVYRPPMQLDGGNLLSDGLGTCYTAQQKFSPYAELLGPGSTDPLYTFLGCRKIFWLRALEGEPSGHVDMFLKVAPRGVVLLGRYTRRQDEENADVLDMNEALLASERDARGRAITVLRVPMASHDEEVFRTYLNATVVNRLVLLPTYPGHPREERLARVAYRLAFPGRRVVGIPSEGIIQLAGAIHCATRTRPLVNHRARARSRPFPVWRGTSTEYP